MHLVQLLLRVARDEILGVSPDGDDTDRLDSVTRELRGFVCDERPYLGPGIAIVQNEIGCDDTFVGEKLDDERMNASCNRRGAEV